jgi:hypothetical protein
MLSIISIIYCLDARNKNMYKPPISPVLLLGDPLFLENKSSERIVDFVDIVNEHNKIGVVFVVGEDTLVVASFAVVVVVGGDMPWEVVELVANFLNKYRSLIN